MKIKKTRRGYSYKRGRKTVRVDPHSQVYNVLERKGYKPNAVVLNRAMSSKKGDTYYNVSYVDNKDNLHNVMYKEDRHGKGKIIDPVKQMQKANENQLRRMRNDMAWSNFNAITSEFETKPEPFPSLVIEKQPVIIERQVESPAVKEFIAQAKEQQEEFAQRRGENKAKVGTSSFYKQKTLEQERQQEMPEFIETSEVEV